jgi:serine protease AprX
MPAKATKGKSDRADQKRSGAGGEPGPSSGGMPTPSTSGGMPGPSGGEMPTPSTSGGMPGPSGGEMPTPSTSGGMPGPSGGEMPTPSTTGGMPGVAPSADAAGEDRPQDQPSEWAPQLRTRGGDGQGASEGAGGEPEGTVAVLVEMEAPSADLTEATRAAADFSTSGFTVDADYTPIPVAPSTSSAAQAEGRTRPSVVVRGRIEASRMAELRRDPRVIDVHLDTPIAPFAIAVPPATRRAAERGEEAIGSCPIAPCDCQPGVPKGDMGTVATFLGAADLHALGITGSGVTVAVVDGGITADGRPVAGGETSRRIPNVTAGWPSDWGTRASAWGEHGNMTSTDVLGMAPDAQINDIRISQGNAISQALAGYQWALDQHRATGTPHILTNSWGIFQEAWDPDYARNPDHPFTRKVVELLDEGILILFAAGNCGGAECADGRCGNDTGPGRDIWGANGHPRVMTVGAVNTRGEFVGYSSRGPAALDPHKPDFCSATHFTGYFNSDSGTSAATPIAAGIVALLKQSSPSLTQEQAKMALTSSARDIGPAGWDEHTGSGIINARAARDRLAGGRLEVFARGSDRALWNDWQTSPGGAWSGWSPLGGWIDSPVVARNADGRLEVFVIGSDHGLWNNWQVSPGGGWSGWNGLGGWIDQIAVAQNADGRLEVFARGSDAALWNNWQTSPGGAWSGWNGLGGWIDQPRAVVNADGRLEVFVIGSDQALWNNWQTSPGGGWSGWNGLGGWIDRLAAAQNADGRLEVFARGSDRALWNNWQTSPGGGWSGWNGLGGWIDKPAVGRNLDGRLEVFVVGSDAGLWHNWQTSPGGGWSGWNGLGGWVDQPQVAHNGDGRLEVFVIGSDHGLWNNWQVSPGGAWSGWNGLGGWIDQLTVGQNLT